MIKINKRGGVCYYNVNNVYHRTGDLPAVVIPSGFVAYYENGVRHRYLGPAVIQANGTEYRYVKGSFIY